MVTSSTARARLDRGCARGGVAIRVSAMTVAEMSCDAGCHVSNPGVQPRLDREVERRGLSRAGAA